MWSTQIPEAADQLISRLSRKIDLAQKRNIYVKSEWKERLTWVILQQE